MHTSGSVFFNIFFLSDKSTNLNKAKEPLAREGSGSYCLHKNTLCKFSAFYVKIIISHALYNPVRWANALMTEKIETHRLK